MKILVTGSAGFIGAAVAKRLIERGDSVVGLDNVNDYYDLALKRDRLAMLEDVGRRQGGDYAFIEASVADKDAVAAVFSAQRFDRVIHLAAQAGVRYSIENPMAYVESNLIGFAVILEACRQHGVQHLTYASTSSVYGANTTIPFAEAHGVDHPVQFYAATKRANELMAHSYSHLFALPTTGLRFFTVYGPWGRPDMAPILFTRKILAGEPIAVFNHGNHSRDFTYIADIVEGVIRASDHVATPDPDWSSDNPDPATSNAPFRVYNIGNGSPVKLMDFIAAIEAATGRRAQMEMLPLQPGDVPDTYADSSRLARDVGYHPSTPVDIGVRALVDWYVERYG